MEEVQERRMYWSSLFIKLDDDSLQPTVGKLLFPQFSKKKVRSKLLKIPKEPLSLFISYITGLQPRISDFNKNVAFDCSEIVGNFPEKLPRKTSQKNFLSRVPFKQFELSNLPSVIMQKAGSTLIFSMSAPKIFQIVGKTSVIESQFTN